MSGHSKWATTKRAKAIVDGKRGAIFTKLSNLITIAAKKGGDQNANSSLRIAIDKARAASMPKDNIEKAIKRGTGELAGATIEELIYEGMGPAKTQFIVKSLTDNKNRSASTIRHAFTKYGGSFGSVTWNFDQKGVIMISKDKLDDAKIDWDSFELELIDAGCDDIAREEEGATIYTKIDDFQKVKNFLEEKNIAPESAEIEFVSKEDVALEDADKETVEKFIEELEDNEDVADYYHNIANLAGN